MKKEEIHLWDIKRILFGQAPPEFLLEVFIRTLIVYLVTLVILRWLGKRMSGQLTITEVAVMITMGAIISLPMQAPDRGILQGILALLIAVFLVCMRKKKTNQDYLSCRRQIATFFWQKFSPDNLQACCHCGKVQTVRDEEEPCGNCGQVAWAKAVLN